MRPLPTALLSLLAGLGIAAFGHGVVRGTAGDVLIIVFLVASAATLRLGTPVSRVATVTALALALEHLQLLELVAPLDSQVLHMVLGSTYDPLDLMAYAVGAGLAAGLERHWLVLAPTRFRDHNHARRRPSRGETTS